MAPRLLATIITPRCSPLLYHKTHFSHNLCISLNISDRLASFAALVTSRGSCTRHVKLNLEAHTLTTQQHIPKDESLSADPPSLRRHPSSSPPHDCRGHQSSHGSSARSWPARPRPYGFCPSSSRPGPGRPDEPGSSRRRCQGQCHDCCPGRPGRPRSRPWRRSSLDLDGDPVSQGLSPAPVIIIPAQQPSDQAHKEREGGDAPKAAGGAPHPGITNDMLDKNASWPLPSSPSLC